MALKVMLSISAGYAGNLVPRPHGQIRLRLFTANA